MLRNFEPTVNYRLATSTASANQAVAATTGTNQMYLHNDSASTALVIWGGGAQTAADGAGSAATCMSLPANSAQIVTKNNADNIACILLSGTGFLRISLGQGM